MNDVQIEFDVFDKPIPQSEMDYFDGKLRINYAIINNEFHSINYEIIGQDKFTPGQKILLYVLFDCPDLFIEKLYIGQNIIFWCSGSEFGSGKIINIIDLEEHIRQIKNTKDLWKLMPRSVGDYERIERYQLIGFPKINFLLHDLVALTKDCNWPVFKPICELMKNAGEEIIVEIKQVFNSNDEEWIYSVMILLVNLNIEIQKKLFIDVENLLHINMDQNYKHFIINYLNTIKKSF